MKQAITIFVTGLAVAGAVTLVSGRSTLRDEAQAAPRMSDDVSAAYAQAGDRRESPAVPVIVFAPRYTSSPRIIHVRQPNTRDEAHYDGAAPRDGASPSDMDADYVAPPHPPMVKRIKRAPRPDIAPVAPDSVQTSKTDVELSPIYPTPRFSKSTAAVPRDPPVEAPPPPPVGYTPPSDLPPERK